MPHRQRGGFPVYERSFGHGDERAVLLHCALAHSKSWARLAALLSERLTMLAPDMPGHGRSAAWDHRCDIHDQVTAIAKDCLENGGHLIGHSFGATVALRVAMENPDAVYSLILIEPVLFAAAKQSDPLVFQEYTREQAVLGQALKRGDWETAAKEFTRVWGAGPSWDSLTEKERMMFTSQMPLIRETEDTLLHDLAGLLRPGRLERIACPTLLISGGATNPVIPAIHHTLARRCPRAQSVVIPKAGHMAPITHPQPVASAILAHLDRV
ncbi:alpha/beta fold hydrolase [Marivita sp. S0852]|uniref:alpha/beta fold hydrolase n=1 Tax=Marivita sp. S0852 TaxID=3373893 RepID=UPI0039825F3E